MGIKVTVNKKFIVNGREYGSLEEMPADVRQAYEKAISISAGGKFSIGPVNAKSEIVFNGQAYASVTEMPADIRQAYDNVIAAVQAGQDRPPEAERVRPVSAKPIEPASAFSSGSRMWKAVAAIGLVLIVFYLLLRVLG